MITSKNGGSEESPRGPARPKEGLKRLLGGTERAGGGTLRGLGVHPEVQREEDKTGIADKIPKCPNTEVPCGIRSA